LTSSEKDHTSVFKVKNVVVKVDTLKKQIQKAIRDAIQTGMESVDGRLVGVCDRMAEAKVNEGESRTQVLQDLFKRKNDDSSVRTSESKSQFKIVAEKRNSMLAEEANPAGWVNRTAEKEREALRGEAWHSDAFNIVTHNEQRIYTNRKNQDFGQESTRRAAGHCGKLPQPLMQLDELPDCYKNDEPFEVKEVDESTEGCSQRRWNVVSYNDGLSDKAWAMASEEGKDVHELTERV
jgi:hypothetical protein